VKEISTGDLLFKKYGGEAFPSYFTYNEEDQELVDFYREDVEKLQKEKLTYPCNSSFLKKEKMIRC